MEEAIKEFRSALKLKPELAEAHHNLAIALAQSGDLRQAIEEGQEAVRLKPDYREARQQLMAVLLQAGRTQEAIEQCRKAVQQAPDDPQINRLVAWWMATHEAVDGGDPEQAVAMAERACALTGRRDVVCLDTLSAAYASAGRFDDAVATAKEAWQLAQAAGESSLAEEIHIRLQRYRDRRPYREPPGNRTKGHP